MESSGNYQALVSSDWNECLAPSGPFDAIFFNYPDLEEPLNNVFRRYTSNEISLGEAIAIIDRMIPGPITEEMMDRYLEVQFKTYSGVIDFISWCHENGILFMINTTGMVGFFQRVLAMGLLPSIPALSAHPFIRYAPGPTDPPLVHPLLEIEDKATNTAFVAQDHGIQDERIIIMGDSGGDGPHFAWGQRIGALLVASHPKKSLERYCRENGIFIHHRITPADPTLPPQPSENEADLEILKEIITDFLSA